MGTTSRDLIRRPTAPLRERTDAPAYTLDRPLEGVRVGLRHEGSWRSWMWMVEEWEEYIRIDGGVPVVLEAGERTGSEGAKTRAAVEEWAADVDCAVSGLGTCGSCTSNSVHDAVTVEDLGKPAIVAVCEEFAQHGQNMATYLGHGHLKQLVLPYPLEGLPEAEIREIAAQYYPKFLRILGVTE